MCSNIRLRRPDFLSAVAYILNISVPGIIIPRIIIGMPIIPSVVGTVPSVGRSIFKHKDRLSFTFALAFSTAAFLVLAAFVERSILGFVLALAFAFPKTEVVVGALTFTAAFLALATFAIAFLAIALVRAV